MCRKASICGEGAEKRFESLSVNGTLTVNLAIIKDQAASVAYIIIHKLFRLVYHHHQVVLPFVRPRYA